MGREKDAGGSGGNGKSNEEDVKDRRSAERVPVEIPVDYRSEKTFLFASIRNISELGIFVETRDPLPPGTSLTLHFDLPVGTRVEERGEVVWINPYRPGEENLNPGMGIRFLSLSPQAREMIVDLVRKIAYLPADDNGEAS
jgi:type IV pilus assembly protein PilZ